MRLGESDPSPQSLNGFAKVGNGGAILMRKLPRNTSREALRSMLLFAKDFIDADFVSTDFPEDSGFLTAIARFATLAAADEARALLDGKPNSKNDANMVVDVLRCCSSSNYHHNNNNNNGNSNSKSNNSNGLMSSNLNNNVRRNTVDHSAIATTSTTHDLLGSIPSNGPLSRQSSRFNDTFQSLERLSATSNNNNSSANNGHSHCHKHNHNNNGDALPVSAESGSRLHSLFSPQSPIGNGVHDFPRVSGKSMIDQDLDEDTGELLKDPVGYAENGHSASSVAIPRRSTNPQIPPTSRFASLSLTSNVSPPLSSQNYTSSVGNGGNNCGGGGGGGSGRLMPAPASAYAQPVNHHNNAIGASHGYHYGSGNGQHTTRHSLPAANPNDLNPPCNTLYVGNLPPDTSEEELKALFSKQRGYKRLCFRNKQNGPMCFVEFDEVAMASKALNELYGYKLSNSVKTGIRLSFSKNPLGVRSGQPGSLNSVNPLTSPGSVPGGNALSGGLPHHMFSTVSGPPPGLAVPPGLSMPVALRNGSIHASSAGNPHMSVTNGTFNPNAAALGLRTNGLNTVIMTTPPLGGVGVGGSSTPSPNMATFNTYYPDYMMGR